MDDETVDETDNEQLGSTDVPGLKSEETAE